MNIRDEFLYDKLSETRNEVKPELSGHRYRLPKCGPSLMSTGIVPGVFQGCPMDGPAR